MSTPTNMRHVFRDDWLVAFGDHIIGIQPSVEKAVDYALRILSWERNVRIIAPNGVRLTVKAASHLL